MRQYLLSVYSVGTSPSRTPAEVNTAYQQVDALNAELQAAGAWVFAGGLHPPATATVVQVKAGELLITDGPFVEGKEHIGGFWVIAAADLDGALEWASKAARACGEAVEVRPFQDMPETSA